MTDKETLLPKNHIEDESSLRYMLKLAAPMVVTTISLTIMQFVDRYMVSRLGKEALAAILPAGLVSFLPSGFAIGAMTSLNTFVSQSLGRGDKRSCSNYFWQAIYMGLAYFLVIVAVMWPTAPWIFKMMGHPPTVIGMEVIYLRIMLYAHIPAIFNYAGSQFFMGIHRPVITMFASLCGQVVNITANYVLIFGKLGLPEMGIAGAGWGTFIGIAVGSIINMAVFLSRGMNAVFRTKRTLHIDFGKMYDLLKVGLPAGVGLMVNVAFWGVVLCGLVGKFGTEELAATSAVLAYNNLSIMPVVGISIALAAAVGKTIGQDRKKIAMKQSKVCLKIALIYMVLVAICFLVFRKYLMAFLSSDEKVTAIGTDILVCAAIYQVFHAARTIYGGALQGAGDTVWLAMASAVGAVLILGLGGWLIAMFLPNFGALGPWSAAAISVIVVGLANRWRFKSKKWMKIDLFKRRPVGVPVEV
jgi:MATE family multidrug resistance protein